MHIQQPDILTRLWTAARAMFDRLRAGVGEAPAIAARQALSEEERASIRAWLRPIEAMVRKIVLIEAMALARAPEPLRPKPAPARRQQRVSRERATTSLRLWPRSSLASAGPRIRSLGPPVLVVDIFRDRARLAAARHLNAVRFMRRPEPQRLARRIAALERVIAKPLAAARRLARKLRALPRLALQLACKTPPRTRIYSEPELALVNVRAFGDARVFADTS